jgi:hypothetical protein
MCLIPSDERWDSDYDLFESGGMSWPKAASL